MELETEILKLKKELMNSQKESEDLAIGIDLKYEKELKNLKRLLSRKKR